MGIGPRHWVYTWYVDGTVTAGTSTQLHSRLIPKRYSLPPATPTTPAKRPADIVGMGIDGTNNWVFAWYRDGTVSAGTSTDLGSHRQPYDYHLALRSRDPDVFYTPDDVVGMAIDGPSDHTVFAFYRDGRVSAGTSDDLESKRRAYDYYLPANEAPDDIVGIAIDDDNHVVFVWFRDGTVSAGTTENMMLNREPKRYAAGR